MKKRFAANKFFVVILFFFFPLALGCESPLAGEREKDLSRGAGAKTPSETKEKYTSIFCGTYGSDAALHDLTYIQGAKGKDGDVFSMPSWDPWSRFENLPFGLQEGKKYRVYLGETVCKCCRQKMKNQVLKIEALDPSPQEALVLDLFKGRDSREDRRKRILRLNTGFKGSCRDDFLVDDDVLDYLSPEEWFSNLCKQFQAKIEKKSLTLFDVWLEIGMPDEIKLAEWEDAEKTDIEAIYYFSSADFTMIQPQRGVAEKSCPKITFKAKGEQVLSMSVKKYTVKNWPDGTCIVDSEWPGK